MARPKKDGTYKISLKSSSFKDKDLSLEDGAISAFGWGDYGFGNMFFKESFRNG